MSGLRRRFAALAAGLLACVGGAVVVSQQTGDNTSLGFRAHGSCLAHPERPLCATTTSSGATTTGATTTIPSTTSAPTTTSPGGLRTIPDPLYAITFDNDNGAGNTKLNEQVATLNGLPHFPTLRIVFDEGQPPDGYVNALNRLQPEAFIVGEVLDSSYIHTPSPAAYEARFQTYTTANATTGWDPTKVDIWEVGNEVNGNWTGTTDGEYVSVADKVTRATDVVDGKGKRTMLTLWENNFGTNNCGNGTYNPTTHAGEETPQQFSNRLTLATRQKIDYVTVSWYPTLCKGKPNGNSNLISGATIANEVQSLHGLYPNAKVGFGELGLPGQANTAAKITTSCAIINHYYRLTLPTLSFYIGAYFWWYAAQDVVPTAQPLFPVLRDAMAGTPAGACP